MSSEIEYIFNQQNYQDYQYQQSNDDKAYNNKST